MHDLSIATEVRPREGNPADTSAGDLARYEARLFPEWEIWGPAGGYVAAVALRAAGLHCGRGRPASLSAQFLGVGSFDAVSLRCTTIRQTRVATAVRVEMTQEQGDRGERPILNATVWGVDAELEGLDHQTDERPGLAGPESFPTMAERAPDQPPSHPFWANLDARPTAWIEDWDNRPMGPATERQWYRFRPTDRFDDAWVDAGRTVIVADLDGWPAAVRGQAGGELDVFAPTVDLSVRFLRSTTDEPWLLGVAKSPAAAGGLIGHQAEVWNQANELVAIGGSTLLCRPAARRPDR